MQKSHQFPWVFTVLWLSVLLLMMWAGFWQLDRASQKDRIRQQMQSGTSEQPKTIDSWQKIKDYQNIEVTGRYHNSHFLLANQFHDGQVGLHVLTPFLTINGIWLLVNRGWVFSAGIDVTVPEQTVVLNGMMADWPRPGVQLGEQVLQDTLKQQVTYLPPEQTRVFMTRRLCQRNGCVMLDRVVKLDAAAEHGFVRDWQAPMMTAARHRAYAFQWFTMSAALCLIFFYFMKKSYATKE